MAASKLYVPSFFSWFCSHGGFIDNASVDIVEFPGQGCGMIATSDIPEGHTLFSLPRSLTLSLRTSTLPSIFGKELWVKANLHKGWVGLILCMMWEESLGDRSRWSPYLASLPTSFSTPMFWNEEDISELKGAAVVDKIGKDDAERDYYDKLVPAIQSRPDIFSVDSIGQYYTLQRYHLNGSRILSRSFHVEKWEGPVQQGNVSEDANTSADSGMNVEADSDFETQRVNDEMSISLDQDDSDDEDQEDPADVAMVPMADILNARYGCENAKLYYEDEDLKMITIKPIKVGEQIWNTYGNPPNSDLLRRYGHIDLVPLPQGGEGNPADVVEVRADSIVSVVLRHGNHLTPEDRQNRIESWLDEGGNDDFVFENDLKIPDELVSFIHWMLLSDAEWQEARDKGKFPKAKLNSQVLSVVAEVLTNRLNEYPTTLEVDEDLLSQDLSINKRHAVIVRVGEKRILTRVIAHIKTIKELLKDDQEKGRKRTMGGSSGESQRSKKTRR